MATDMYGWPRITRIVLLGAVMLVGMFVVDVVLKIIARQMLPMGERFAFATPVGLVGFVPSENTVLAFSLPVPNAWIWPMGWVVVLALLTTLLIRHRDSVNGSPLASAAGGVRGGGVAACQQSHPPQLFESCEVASRTRNDDHYGGCVPLQFAMLAIILGAISNLLDRTFRGGVTDYLSLTVFFPAFNSADLMIIGGIVGWWWASRVPKTASDPL